MTDYTDKHARLVITGFLALMVIAYMVWLVSVYLRFQDISENMKEEYRVWLAKQSVVND
jgi:high-affinity Fe2+/Pb2+ permease